MRWPRRRQRFPTVEEIRAGQEAAVARVEAQLAAGADLIEVEGRLIHREPAWAATSALRKAWDVGALYEGQTRLSSGAWVALVETADGGIEEHGLGRFPG